jgi:hypothetical protein
MFGITILYIKSGILNKIAKYALFGIIHNFKASNAILPNA